MKSSQRGRRYHIVERSCQSYVFVAPDFVLRWVHMRSPFSLATFVFAPLAASFTLMACVPAAGNAGRVTTLLRHESPCDVAAKQRARVPDLLAEGRLDRTIRVIRHADTLCPQSAPATWVALVKTLADVGRADEAREVAASIESSPSASRESKAEAKRIIAAMSRDLEGKADTKRAAEAFANATIARGNKRFADAKRGFVEAWTLSRPNGRALYWAGIAARDMGDNADARRHFDRAMVDFEQTTGKPVIIQAPAYTSNAYVTEISAWSTDGRWLAVTHGKTISIRDRFLDFTETLTLENKEAVDSLALSPDGTIVAAASREGTLQVTRLLPHIEDISIQLPERWSGPLAFSADGKTLAVGNSFFDLSTGNPKRDIGRASGASTLALSPDGKTFAMGAPGGGAVLWDIATGKQVRSFEGIQWDLFDDHDRFHFNTKAVAFSPDGKTLAAGSDAELIFLWDVATGAVKKELRHDRAYYRAQGNSLVFSPDGKKLASNASAINDIRIFDLETGNVIEANGHGLGSFWFSPDGKTLSLGQVDGDVSEWNASSGSVVSAIPRGAWTCENVAFSPDGRTVAMGCPGEDIRLWDALDGKTRLHRHHPYGSQSAPIAYSRDGKNLFLLSRKYDVVQLLDVHTGHARTMTIDAVGLSPVLSPDAETIAIVNGKWVRLWTFDTGARDLVGQTDYVHGVAFSPDGKTIASANEDKMARLWDVSTMTEVRRFEGHTGPVQQVRFSPDGTILASLSDDKSVRLWDVATGKQTHVLEGYGLPMFSPDGTMLALPRWPDVCLWDRTKAMEVRRIKDLHSIPVAYSPDGKMLITVGRGGDDNFMRFWTSTGDALFALRFIADHNASVVLSPDGAPYVEIMGPDEDAARKHLQCRAGNDTYSFDLCRERFEVRGLLSKLRAGDRSYVDP